jgi:hypothetical protein
VVIKRSSSAEVTRLLQALLDTDPVGRETAAARLAILGSRVVERLVALLPSLPDADRRTAVLDVLERIGDARGAVAATPWLRNEDPAVALAAVAVVRRTLGDEVPDAAALAAEALAATAMDAAQPRPIRDAAFEALTDLPREVVEPLLAKFPDERSSDQAPAADGSGRRKTSTGPPLAPGAPGIGSTREPRAGIRTRVADGEVDSRGRPGAVAVPRDTRAPGSGGPGLEPGDARASNATGLASEDVARLAAWVQEEPATGSPEEVRRALAGGAREAPLSLLHHLVTKARRVEADAAGREAEQWRVLRGAAHQVLADRGSRVALYDLRETLEHPPGTLPVSMLAALAAVGDTTCLDATASAWAATGDAWLKDQLRDAFAAIVSRERLTRRHASLRRVAAHHPALLDTLSTPSRTTRSPSRPRRT